jgi:hypothetical protein
MIFRLSKFFNISPFSLEAVEYFEFLYQYEKMLEYEKLEADANRPQGDISSMFQGK